MWVVVVCGSHVCIGYNVLGEVAFHVDWRADVTLPHSNEAKSID